MMPVPLTQVLRDHPALEGEPGKRVPAIDRDLNEVQLKVLQPGHPGSRLPHEHAVRVHGACRSNLDLEGLRRFRRGVDVTQHPSQLLAGHVALDDLPQVRVVTGRDDEFAFEDGEDFFVHVPIYGQKACRSPMSFAPCG